MKSLYETDFHEWALRNAELLRSGQIDEADIPNIAEELEGMGISQRRELASRLRILVTHLLKWQHQPRRRSESWKAALHTQRLEILDLLAEMPSLRGRLADDLPRIYQKAIIAAVGETGLPENHFPNTCPYTLKQILDIRFLPKAR